MFNFTKLVWFVCLLQNVLCQFDESQFTRQIVMDEDENYKLFWKYDENEATVTFGAQVKTTGYIGLGFSPNGGMVESDIFTGWVNDGKVYGQDRYSTEQSLPPVDSKQDFEIISGEENDTHTAIVFKRPVASCNSNDADRTISVGATRLIWSFGQDDPVDNDETKLLYHNTNRGTKTVYLLDEPMQDFELPNDAQTWDLLNENVSIPDNSDTTYWCHAFKVPEFGGEKHIIKYEPIIQEGHEKIVHHILVYECYNEISDDYDNFNHKCYEPQLGPLQNCLTVFISWAIGGGTFYYPENVGYPLGLEDSPKFVVMEVHYDNPGYATNPGLIDSSGIRVHYTSELREHRAGLFEIGSYVDTTLVIPPGISSFVVNGICDESCLTKAFPEDVEELTVFGGLVHSHLAGQSLRARHFRGGYELPPILVDEAYDFNLQRMRPVNDIKIKNGDSIISQCTYNTEGRTSITYGGLSTKEEMCLTFLLYYPKIDLMACESKPSVNGILERATGVPGFEVSYDYYVIQPKPYQNQSYYQILYDTDWTDDENVRRLEEVYLKEQYQPWCVEAGVINENPYKPFEGPFDIQEEWVDVDPTCKTMEEELTTPSNMAMTTRIDRRLLLLLVFILNTLLTCF